MPVSAEFSIFNPSMLEWAMDRVGMTKQDLSDALRDHSGEKLKSWLNGNKKPTIKQAETLASLLGIPLGYLCLDTPPDESPLTPDLRTIGNRPLTKYSVGLRLTLEHALACQDFLSDYLRNNDYPEFEYKKYLSLTMKPEEAAVLLADLIGHLPKKQKPEDNLRLLKQKIENLGILVQKNGVILNKSRKPLNRDEFRGFALCDDYAPLIFINGNDALQATVFTLIHELVHILLDQPGLSDHVEGSNRKNIELFCDKVTAEFLVPKNEFCDFWEANKSTDVDELITKAHKYFGVSTWVILRRAYHLGLLRKEQYEERVQKLVRLFSTKKKNIKGGPSYNVVQDLHNGERLVNAAVTAAYAGDITFSEAEALTLLGLNGIQQKAQELRL